MLNYAPAKITVSPYIINTLLQLAESNNASSLQMTVRDEGTYGISCCIKNVYFTILYNPDGNDFLLFSQSTRMIFSDVFEIYLFLVDFLPKD